MAEKCAPFTKEEVDNIKAYQEGPLHNLNCGSPEHIANCEKKWGE